MISLLEQGAELAPMVTKPNGPVDRDALRLSVTESNPEMTPELVYLAFGLSEEYQHY